MQAVEPAALLREFADFTGLSFDPAVLEDRLVAARCQTSKGGHAPNHQSFSEGMVRTAARAAPHVCCPSAPADARARSPALTPARRAPRAAAAQTQGQSDLLHQIFAPYDDMLELWLKHYGVRTALQTHPAVIARRARLRKPGPTMLPSPAV